VALRSRSDSAPIEGGAAPERKMRDPATQAVKFLGRHTSWLNAKRGLGQPGTTNEWFGADHRLIS